MLPNARASPGVSSSGVSSSLRYSSRQMLLFSVGTWSCAARATWRKRMANALIASSGLVLGDPWACRCAGRTCP